MIQLETDRKQWMAAKLKASMSFEDYLKEVEQQVKASKTSGLNQSAEYVEYTKMGYQRMTRWLKTLNPEQFAFDFSVDKKITMLTLTESWCGDAAHVSPVLHYISLQNGLSLRFLYRDQHLDLMDEYLTNGGRSIPKVIFIDEQLNELASWGPRPAHAQELYIRLKATGDVQKIIHGLQMWYNKDKGACTKLEIETIIRNLLKA
ncbi:thioredoxin [Thermaurantimonas aggregans]|uniref:Thioredoxin n=1 Tax=Thermaurantimonas aggregans TaxID=2173829 RepID=A0A401XN15_9FLAO|nr:thioredoxin family protein [Thermaurantimonas aggregans]MCX8149727.1 thioredoxin family protein [Thermaurantimonas aggregans]GCD78395.1 thioredoxin [Thermaurantimonas aggregans]